MCDIFKRLRLASSLPDNKMKPQNMSVIIPSSPADSGNYWISLMEIDCLII